MYSSAKLCNNELYIAVQNYATRNCAQQGKIMQQKGRRTMYGYTMVRKKSGTHADTYSISQCIVGNIIEVHIWVYNTYSEVYITEHTLYFGV